MLAGAFLSIVLGRAGETYHFAIPGGFLNGGEICVGLVGVKGERSVKDGVCAGLLVST